MMVLVLHRYKGMVYEVLVGDNGTLYCKVLGIISILITGGIGNMMVDHGGGNNDESSLV